MELNQQRNIMEIDLKEIFSVVLKKIAIIILAGIICGIGGYLVSNYVIEKEYQSSTKIYVITRQDNSTLTYTDMETGRQLTKDYVELVTARPVLEEVIDKLNLKIDTDTLKDMISVEVPIDTRILKITVTTGNPNESKKIADAIRKASSTHITNVMDIQTVNVVEEANLPEHPSSPNTKMNTIIAAGLGLFISMFIVILLHVLDDTIKNTDDVEKYLGVSVLGIIPQDNKVKSKKRKKKVNSKKRR